MTQPGDPGSVHEEKRLRQEQLAESKELRHNSTRVASEIEYIYRLLASIDNGLSEIDQAPAELNELPKDQRDSILQKRNAIIHALCQRITIHDSGEVVIDGLIDPSGLSSFGLKGP